MELNCSNCELYNKCLMYSLALAYGKTINTITDRDVLVKKFVEEHKEAQYSISCKNFSTLESEADRAYSMLSILDVKDVSGEDLIWMIYHSNRR